MGFVQYALLMMPIAAAIEEKVPATTSRSASYAKLLSSEAGKRRACQCLVHRPALCAHINKIMIKAARSAIYFGLYNVHSDRVKRTHSRGMLVPGCLSWSKNFWTSAGPGGTRHRRWQRHWRSGLRWWPAQLPWRCLCLSSPMSQRWEAPCSGLLSASAYQLWPS